MRELAALRFRLRSIRANAFGRAFRSFFCALLPAAPNPLSGDLNRLALRPPDLDTSNLRTCWTWASSGSTAFGFGNTFANDWQLVFLPTVTGTLLPLQVTFLPLAEAA